MDGENILMLKAGNLRCHYVQMPDGTALSEPERRAAALLRGMYSLQAANAGVPRHKIMDRMWYEKIGLKRVDLTAIGRKHIDVNCD